MTTRIAPWRAAIDPDVLREYDAFGPWIFPIATAAEMPRRFRDHYPDLAAAEWLLKIPRELDRGQVRPGDDLYRSVVAVFDDRLTLLHAASPNEGEVEQKDVRFAEVVGFSASENLLQGHWTLLLRDGGRVTIAHSATSADLMAKVAGFVRERIVGAERPLPDAGVQPAEHLFKGRLLALGRQFGSALPLHVDPRNIPCRTGRGWPRLSTGAMIVATAAELVIVNRGEATRPVFMPNYAVGTVELPYERLDSFTLRLPARWSSFQELALRAGEQEYVQPFLNAPDAVVAHLRRIGLPELA